MGIISKGEWIAKDIQYRIFEHPGKFDQILSSERQLSVEYEVSRNTIRNAITILENREIIQRDGKEYRLLPTKEDFETLEIMGKQSWQTQNTVVLDTSFETNKVQSQELMQPLGTNVRKISYVRTLADSNTPIGIETVALPTKALDDEAVANLYYQSILLFVGKQFSEAFSEEYQQVNLEHADEKMAQLLKVHRGEVVVGRHSLFVSKDNSIFVELKSSILPRFSVIVQPDQDINTKVDGFVE